MFRDLDRELAVTRIIQVLKSSLPFSPVGKDEGYSMETGRTAF